MLTQIVIYLLLTLSAFSLAIIFGKTFEEMIPLVLFGIVFLVFMGGMLYCLTLGIMFIFITLTIIFSRAIVLLRRCQHRDKLLKHLFTPAFLLFTIVYVCASLINIGRVVVIWDEFSMWASSVKIMVFWDQFSNIKDANLIAASYPPGMSCFHYFVQKINTILQGTLFSEWRLYFTYQLFTYTLFQPFLKGLKHKQVLNNLIIAVVLFFTPLFILDYLYQAVYIDTFLGVLFGIGVAVATFWEKMGAYYEILLASILGMLVLAKPVGIFFAILVVLFMLIRTYKHNKLFLRRCLIVATLSICIPYILWQISVNVSDCHILLNNKFDYCDLINVILGRGNALRTDIFEAFLEKLTEPIFPLYINNIQTTLIVIIIPLFSLVFILTKRIRKILSTTLTEANVLLLSLMGLVVYTLGLLMVYLYKIPNVSIPSFVRYMGIYLLGVISYVTCSLISLFKRRRDKFEALVAIIIILLGPKYDIYVAFSSFSNSLVIHGQKYQNISDFTLKKRNSFTGIAERCKIFLNQTQAVDEQHKYIFFLNRSTDTFPYLPIYFYMLPSVVKTQNVTNIAFEDFQIDIITNYNAFIIWKVDDYFRNNFSSLFSDPSTIADQTIYRVNKETGLLDLVTENADT